VLLATDPALYGRLCTCAALGRSTTLTIEVFREWDEAEQWLTAQAKAMEKAGVMKGMATVFRGGSGFGRCQVPTG